jgi:hypothetical protein
MPLFVHGFLAFLIAIAAGVWAITGERICFSSDVFSPITESAAASFGVSGVSANDLSPARKDVGGVPVVVPELELRNVRRHVLAADKAADDSSASTASPNDSSPRSCILHM